MVDIVGELFFDAFFFLLLVHGRGVFAIPVSDGLLQACVEPDDVV